MEKILYHGSPYKLKILDPKNSNLIYGCSGNWSGEKPPFEHNWPSWKSIYYDEKRKN